MSAPSPDREQRIRYVEVDGVRLRTSVRGTGPPLLVLTGIGAPLELSAPVERALNSQGVQTIALDAPGTGESTRYRQPRRMPGVARTVERTLDALGYDRVDVLGISFGGILAQQLAHQAPERVRRLVLAATAAGIPGLGGVPGSPRAMLALATPRRYQSPDYYRRIAGTLYGGQARREPDALLHGSVARFAEAPTLRGYLDQLYAISFWTGLPWLWRLRQPTLVLAGDDDPIVPVINGRILSRILPNARLEVIRGGGHLFLLERPTEHAVRIAAFLKAGEGDVARPAQDKRMPASRTWAALLVAGRAGAVDVFDFLRRKESRAGPYRSSFVEGVLSPFGKAGPKGIYAESRADDLVINCVRELLRRNLSLP